LRELDDGVRISFSTSAKFTVFRGVVRGALTFWLLADRVMSCNLRLDLVAATLEDCSFVLRGVKKRVKRFGVMGGGRFCFLLPVAVGIGGDDEKMSGVGSCSLLRVAHGEDITLAVYIYKKDSK
jgi:hypothetical protein